MGIRTRIVVDGVNRYIKAGEAIPRGRDVHVLYDARVWHEGKEYFEGGFTSRGAAESALGNLRRKLTDIRLGVVEAPKAWDPTFRELAGDPDQEDPGDGTYLAMLSVPNSRAESYVRRVRTAMRPLLAFFGDKKVSEISKDLIRKYATERQATPLQVGEKMRLAAVERRKAEGKPPRRKRKFKRDAEDSSTTPKPPPEPKTVGPACVNRELLSLRACLTWATDPDRDLARRLERNPVSRLEMLQEPEPRNPTLTIEDEQTLLAACRPPWLRELVALLLGTGMRPGEGLALRWSDLNPDQHVLTVRSSKTNRSRLVPVPARVMDMLQARKPKTGDGLVFATRTGLEITSGKAAHHFTPIAEELGFTFTLHCCRHIFASRMLSAGASLPQIAAILGHRSLATSSRYSHANLPDLQTLVEEVSERARPRPRLVEKDEA